MLAQEFLLFFVSPGGSAVQGPHPNQGGLAASRTGRYALCRENGVVVYWNKVDGLCGGEEDATWLGSGGVQGPLFVLGGLAASWAGGHVIVISDGEQVLELHWCTRGDITEYIPV